MFPSSSPKRGRTKSGSTPTTPAAPQHFAPFHKRSSQRRLLSMVRTLFPSHEVEEEASVGERASGRPLSIDVFVPDLALAFEFQGAQHFSDVQVFSPKEDVARRDQEKREACTRQAITLIEVRHTLLVPFFSLVQVPHWWPQNTSDLRREIVMRRPELGRVMAQVPGDRSDRE